MKKLLNLKAFPLENLNIERLFKNFFSYNCKLVFLDYLFF